jgi:hypothetical protein
MERSPNESPVALAADDCASIGVRAPLSGMEQSANAGAD